PEQTVFIFSPIGSAELCCGYAPYPLPLPVAGVERHPEEPPAGDHAAAVPVRVVRGNDLRHRQLRAAEQGPGWMGAVTPSAAYIEPGGIRDAIGAARSAVLVNHKRYRAHDV